jgi:hypothetical protein
MHASLPMLSARALGRQPVRPQDQHAAPGAGRGAAAGRRLRRQQRHAVGRSPAEPRGQAARARGARPDLPERLLRARRLKARAEHVARRHAAGLGRRAQGAHRFPGRWPELCLSVCLSVWGAQRASLVASETRAQERVCAGCRICVPASLPSSAACWTGVLGSC